MNDSIQPVRRRLLIPLTALLLLLVAGFSAGLLSLQKDSLDRSSQAQLETIQEQLDQELQQQSRMLGILENIVLAETGLKPALRARDRPRLLALYRDLFTRLRKLYGITHFYFHRPDGVNLLRLHAPDQFGDRIDRHTLREAEGSGAMAAGIELGSLGTFTLRVVQPVFDGGSLIGYVELGMEIETLLQEIHDNQNAELAILINKSALARETWQAGMRLLGRDPDWDRYPGAVLGFSTLGRLPADLEVYIPEHGHLHGQAISNIEMAGKPWRVLFSPLRDASGAQVGDLIILRDVSAATADFQRLAGLTLGAVLLLIMVLLGFVYHALRKVDLDISRQQAERLRGEQRLNLILNTLPHGIQENDTEGVITYSNPAHHRILGFEPGELLGRHVWDFLPREQQRQEMRAYLDHLVKTQPSPNPLVARNRKNNGEEVSLEIHWDYARDAAGELTGFVSVISDITARARTEAALEASEAHIRMLFDTSPVGLALCRMDGTLIEVNPAYAHIIGRSVEQTLTLSYWQITPDEYAGKEQEQLLSLENSGRFGPYEKEYVHLDGHRVPVRLRGRLIERDGQRLIWSSVEDISAVRESQMLGNRLRNILEYSQDEIYIFGSSGLRFLQASSGALENLGYAMEELQTMTPVDLSSDFTQASFQALIEPLRRGQTQQLVYEDRHRRQDGSDYPVEVRLQLSRQEINPVFFAIVLDLTERRRIEAELDMHRQHLEQLVAERTATIRQQAKIIDQTHDSVVTTSPEGIVTHWNAGAERLFGYSAEEAVGRPISFVYPPHQHEFLRQQVSLMTSQDKDLHETEVLVQHADGSEFPAHLILLMLRDEQGRQTGRVGYAMDISELRQREAELEQLAQSLRAANNELEAFSYSVSHDLRAPLRAIDGFSLALMEDYGERLDDTALDYLGRVRNGAQHMGLLIDDLLQLSRVSSTALDVEDVDLGEIAATVVEELRNREPGRQLQWNADANLRTHGDPRLLRVMLDNLIGNAWKFTSRESTSRIEFGRLEESPQVFYIRDNGVGFDMRHADKLFGAFQRLHRSSDFPGTGVGLATVQRIVHRHGGEVRVEAREGHGATFFFTLEPRAGTPE